MRNANLNLQEYPIGLQRLRLVVSEHPIKYSTNKNQNKTKKTTLCVLECKLRSIPGLDGSGVGVVPTAAESQQPVPHEIPGPAMGPAAVVETPAEAPPVPMIEVSIVS